MLTSTISFKPLDLSIDRDPSWQNIPREVGDGMEAHPSHGVPIIPVQATPHQNVSSLPNSKACSRSSSPFSYSHVYDEDKQRHSSPRMSRSPLPSHTSISSLNASSPGLNNAEKCLIEEKSALKDHLQIQIQVNQELKRLLVASVGEDMGFHYERLSTEKAQLALEVDDLKKSMEARKEEMERLEISCDIWRSKFLASRMQCDDLSAFRRIQDRQARELESALRGLLREHWNRSEHIDALYKTLHRMSASLDKETASQMSLDKDGSTLVEKCRKLANSLSTKLLGMPLKPHIYDAFGAVPSHTPAEKYVLQLLNEMQKFFSGSLSSEAEARTSFPHSTRHEAHLDRTASRLHLHSSCLNATINCCPHCKGDIYVV